MKQYKCELCDNVGVKSSIVGDYYYRHLCYACYDNLMAHESPSSGQAAYNRERDFEDHEADIRQPLTDGKADKEFIRLYPETARKMFTDDEIAQAERS